MNPYEENKQTYSSPKVIDYYDKFEALQAPEETIFEIIKPKLSEMRMLDIGVGGGRTTVFFAPKAKSYTAIDYSEGMIERCREKFAQRFPEAKFFVGDARNLSEFEKHSFDMILFSFNGIDYISEPSRIEFLRSARNILTPGGGTVCFSTHNILSLKKISVISAIHLRWNMFAVLKKIVRTIRIKWINAVQLAAAERSDVVFINDGVHDFGLAQCYVRPAFQVKVLRECGFKSIRGFSSQSGKEYLDEEGLFSSDDPWLYYLCN